jgi:hypothetical protein
MDELRAIRLIGVAALGAALAVSIYLGLGKRPKAVPVLTLGVVSSLTYMLLDIAVGGAM